MEQIYSAYTLTRDEKLIHDAILETTNMQNTLRSWEDEVLQLDGVGPALKNVQDISRNIAWVVNSLEEVLCLAMADYSDLIKVYEDCNLFFLTW